MFYATVRNKDGISFVMDNLPGERIQAEKAAIQHCKNNGLIFESVRLVQGTGKQGDVLTKYYKLRRRAKGFK